MNKLKMVDLFCGAGIGAVGFLKAGYDIIWAVDNNKYAVQTYNKNIGNHAIIADIKDLDLKLIPDSDVITGGFPCNPFSFSGKGEGVNDKEKGDLGKYFLNAVGIKKPKAFFLENVKGLTSKNHKVFFDELISEFEKIGYNITWKVINCVDYGVPQKRKRVFVIGIRKDLKKKFIFPSFIDKKDIKTIRNTIADLPEPDNYKNPILDIKNHYGLGIRNDEKPFIDKVPIGGNWRDIPVEDQKIFLGKSFYSGGGRTGYLKKIPFDEPSNTITSIMDGKFNAQIVDNRDKYKEKYNSSIEKCRRFTVRECLRLQTVPDSFVFDDNIPLRKQYERCSGIPSLVAYIITKEIKKILTVEDYAKI